MRVESLKAITLLFLGSIALGLMIWFGCFKNPSGAGYICP